MEVTGTLAVGVTIINIKPLCTTITEKEMYLPLHNLTHTHTHIQFWYYWKTQLPAEEHRGLKFWTPET